MLLVIGGEAITVSTATFYPASDKGDDAILLRTGDTAQIHEGATARVVWDYIKSLADAVIEVTEVEAK